MGDSELSPPGSPFYGYCEDEVPRSVDLVSTYSDIDDTISPPLSPCFGFHESELPETIISVTAKATPEHDNLDSIEVVRVKTPVVSNKKENKTQKTKNIKVELKNKEAIAAKESKEEKSAEDDDEIFHGFDIKDIPKPIIIKEEPEDVVVERLTASTEPVAAPLLLHGQTKVIPMANTGGTTMTLKSIPMGSKVVPLSPTKPMSPTKVIQMSPSRITTIPLSPLKTGIIGAINFLSGSSDLTVSKTAVPMSSPTALQKDPVKTAISSPSTRTVVISPRVAPGSPRAAPGSPRAAPGSPRAAPGSPRAAQGGQMASPSSPRPALGSPRPAPGSPRQAPGSPRAGPNVGTVRIVSPRAKSPRVSALMGVKAESNNKIVVVSKPELETSTKVSTIEDVNVLVSDALKQVEAMEVVTSIEEVKKPKAKTVAIEEKIAPPVTTRNFGPDIVQSVIKDGTPLRRGRKPSQLNAQTPKHKAGMTVQKIVTVPEPHKTKPSHQLPYRKGASSDRPIRMITQISEGMLSPSPSRTLTTPSPRTMATTPSPRNTTTPSPRTSTTPRLERIVMNTAPRTQITRKEIAQAVVEESVVADVNILGGDGVMIVEQHQGERTMDTLAKCIEETIVTVDSTEAVIPDVVGEMSEEGATIIIRNQTAYQNKPQDSPQHNVMAVEEVEFLEDVETDNQQQMFVVVGEDGTEVQNLVVEQDGSEVQNLEVIQTQNLEMTEDGSVEVHHHDDIHHEQDIDGEGVLVERRGGGSGGLERGELGEVVTDEQGNQIVFRKIEDLARREPKNDIDKITIIETGEGPGTIKTVHSSDDVRNRSLDDKNIQIVDENGDTIVFMEKDVGSDTDSEFEDREFTVIVDDDGSDVEMEDTDISLSRLARLPLEEKNTFEGDTYIEDILAQFEKESTNRAVACPNCKKCFVSERYLSIHISNKVTLCDLCNTQCCTPANLRTHKNVDCDLSKRKRNIDLIAQETELLGRKPIEPEKYYNMPIDSSDEENEQIPRARIVRNVNDHRYECPECGIYVKILSSHMKYIHELPPDRMVTAKYRCPECNVFVTSLANHKDMKHNPDRVVNKLILNAELVVVRCKHLGCDTFFNSMDELSEHVRREHGEQPRLPCGMGDCNAIFDSRGALRKHRTEVHPELDEFKPVDLEPDDPDRDSDFTVACPVCERKFKHKTTCTVHIKVHHLGWVKKKLYECQDCGKGFDNKKGLDFHREAIHLGIRTICPLCEKPVTRLDLHVRMVHSELPEWPCPDCGKRFKRKFDLNRHRVTVHLGVRNFPCDLCGKRFADMKDMTRHKNAVHYGMKIKWNSKLHKEERRKRKEAIARKKQSQNIIRSKLQHQNAFPMELIDSEQDATSLHLTGGAESLVEESVLDPVYKHGDLSGVHQTEEGVFIEVQNHEDDGGVRLVMFNEDGHMEEDTSVQISSEQDEHTVEQEVEGEEIVHMEHVKVSV